ncbi:MAG: hypothetical protein Q4C10_11820 [Clostridia bacterium]|nr:hypothetical protein [Clostridia bacterium]
MKRWICALLAAALLALSVPALAAGSGLKEVIMVYEDYDGNRAEQTIDDEATLTELAEMLKRAKKNPGQLDGCTMNSTLFCVAPSGEIYDFAVATDGCPYITDMDNDKTYTLSEADQARLWEIFDLVQETMGYDANSVLNW